MRNKITRFEIIKTSIIEPHSLYFKGSDDEFEEHMETCSDLPLDVILNSFIDEWKVTIESQVVYGIFLITTLRLIER